MPTRIVEAQWLAKQKRWQIKVQANGIRRAFTSSIPGRAGKAEAHKKADDWLASQIIDGSTPVSVLWSKWVETLTSQDGIYKAKSFWKNHICVIGKKQIAKITVGDLQAIIDSAAKTGLSRKSLANIRATMTAYIKWARKSRYTTITTEDISIPKNAPRGKVVILQPNDVRLLWNAPESHYSNLFKFAVLTGLRPGELIGLKWTDIKESKLSIQRAINYRNKLTNCKNDNANRTIWLGEYELSVLDAQRKALKKNHIISPWVFPSKTGDHATQGRVAISWKLFSENCGISQGVTPYGWRHTFVSVNNDMPSGLKKRRVGHSVSMDTEGVYGHAVVGEGAQAAEYIKQRFDSILKPNQ
jgi:integrase